MKNFDTLCVHPLGREGMAGSVTAAIFPSTSYEYMDEDELHYPGFYSTYNQQRLGEIIAKLEAANWGMVFSSGMAAITTAMLSFVQQGDHIIFSKDLYGGTWKFAEQELPKRNISCSYAGNTLESFEMLRQVNTRVIYIETPANPLLTVVPLKAVAAFAKKHGIITIVDNTFASPINQQPHLQGIDISVHSGTKYLGGHNDLPYGALTAIDNAHKKPIFSTAMMYGGSLSPYECYLAERSLKTLAIRIRKHNENALQLAEYLEANPAINRVYYPGLSSHPDHALAREQMTGFGGILSFELKASPQGMDAFLRSLQMIRPALSLGGVESLVCSPVTTSHRSLSAEDRLKAGIKDNLLRLSAGIEDTTDLINDLDTAIGRFA